jgi:ArsR family transcriptional regulator, arsenate/arsenite/antimonite-responsive transcriptional repressor
MDIEQLTKVSRALADPTRLRIYESIAMKGGEYCGDLAEEAGIAPGTVSHHLKVLTEAHLIVSRRDGQFIFQQAIPETMKRYTKALAWFTRRR